MENYRKARTVERPSVCPFSGHAPDAPEVRVKDGSKIRNLLRYALSRMEAGPSAAEGGGGGGAAVEGQQEGRSQPQEGRSQPQEGRSQPLSRQIVFTATGKAVSKAITCAEIVKRRVKGLYQLTRLQYGTVEEVWEPLEPAAGLDSLTVSRDLPGIWILLSREPLDSSQPGYQPPGRYDALWAQPAAWEEGGGFSGAGHKRKKGGAGGGGGSRGRGPGRQTGRSREAARGQN